MAEQNKSYSQMRKEFYTSYKEEIAPFVKKFDGERKKKLVFAIIGSTFFCILGIVSLLALFINGAGNHDSGSSLKSAVFMFGLGWFTWFSIKKSFENSIKEQIMPKLCKCYGKMKWSEGSYQKGRVFEKSCVIPQYTSDEYDDIFTGIHKDVAFEIVESEYIRGSGKNQRTVFKGVIVKLAMNKNFISHTVIKPDSLRHVSPAKDLRHTVLEDVEFEKKFDVFTNDEVDARYLITPSFMERLNNMKTAFKANSVSCAFYGDLLLVALSTNKDLFSICSLVKPVDDEQQYFQMYEEIVSIIKLIDHFKLDQKIGL